MEEIIKEIEERAILKVSKWWGLRTPGYAGTIITKDKEVYKYQKYSNIPEGLENPFENYVKKVKDLNDNEFEKISNFIHSEILTKDYDSYNMFDAGKNVTVYYTGIDYNDKNIKKIKNNIDLYEKAEELINNIIK